MLVMKDSSRVDPQIPVFVASVVRSVPVGAQEVGRTWERGGHQSRRFWGRRHRFRGRQHSIRGRTGDGVLLVWLSWAWGGHFVSVSATGLVGCCPGWPILGSMAWWTHGTVSVGKRGMVRAGGSASRTSGNSGTTDPGGGGGVLPRSQRNRPVWVSPVGHAHGSGWSPSAQAFPPLGSLPLVFSPRGTQTV